MPAQGVDVSHHQGTIDWPRVNASGIEFAFCKATEGVSFVDSRYQANVAQARATGMVVGAYHFLRAGTSAAQQARHFLNIIGPPTGLLTALDVETGADGTNPTSAQAHEFAAEFARLTGGHPLVLYTGRWYWSGVLGNPHGADIGPLWHSAYTATPGALYGGWPEFTFWQFTSSGSVPGISGGCDVNTFFGTHADLFALTQEDDLLADERAALFHVEQLLAGTSGDRIGDLWNREGDTLTKATEAATQLTTANDGRLGEIWAKLEEILAATNPDVDETALAEKVAVAVLAVLTPEAITAAIPAAVASRVLNELHERLAG